MMRSHRSSVRGKNLPPSMATGSRGRMLQAALHLFSQEGFHGTSIRDLAMVLEVQPSALYSHFPSKEHVLAELVRSGYEFQLDALRKALLETDADPIAQLSTFVATNARLHATYPSLAIVVHEE